MSDKNSSNGIIQRINEWDKKTFLKLYKNRFLKGKKIILFAKIFSFFGNMYFFGMLWVVWVVYGYITKDYYLLVLFTSGFIQSMILHVLIRFKIVKRERPYITLKDKGVGQHDLLIKVDKSFPSGHVSFFLLFGAVIAYYFNDFYWIILLIFIGLDIIMALTRLILGVHFPSDVIGGFILGIFYALLFLGLTQVYWTYVFYWCGNFLSPIIHFWR